MKEVIAGLVVLSQPKVYWRLFSLLLAVIFGYWPRDGNFTSTERIVSLDV